MIDKVNWYDGLFYSRLVDPVVCAAFAPKIMSCIETGATVIDIGCGTGALCERLAEKCGKVVGIDLSSKMISHAEKRRILRPSLPLEFIHGDAALLSEHVKAVFDYAVMTMFIHEVAEGTRSAVIAEAKKVAGCFIIIDYLAPGLGTSSLRFRHMLNRMIEFCAGRGHYLNYRDWLSRGALEGFLERSGLVPLTGSVMNPGTIKMVRAVAADSRE